MWPSLVRFLELGLDVFFLLRTLLDAFQQKKTLIMIVPKLRVHLKGRSGVWSSGSVPMLQMA